MRPYINGNESRYISEALDTTWISDGDFLRNFQDNFSNQISIKYSFAVSSGTAALHLALLSLDLEEGDEIIIPSFCFLASANLCLQLKLKPVFVDIEIDTWCMSPESILRSITNSTKAIIVVHPYGNLCDMNKIMSIANKYNLKVIEDAAEGFPSKYKNKISGTIGHIGTFSFQATKTITTGEGGMVCTNDSKLADKLELLRSHGFKYGKQREKHYWHELPGLNYRMTNIQAAMGCAQLEKINLIIKNKKKLSSLYTKYLESQKGISLQKITKDVEPVIWAFAIKIDTKYFPQGRDSVMSKLEALGIETRPGFYTPSSLRYFNCNDLENSTKIAASTLVLPSYPQLKENEIEYVCKSLLSLRKK